MKYRVTINHIVRCTFCGGGPFCWAEVNGKKRLLTVFEAPTGALYANTDIYHVAFCEGPKRWLAPLATEPYVE